MDRLIRWLGGRHAPLVVALVGLALASPALTAGFAADDHEHRVVSRADPGFPGMSSRPLDLFRFAGGDADDARALRDAGVYPWWTDLDVRLAFLRPLSSATHAVDHRLWPEDATAMLAHNLAWLALALAAAWAFYRRFAAARWVAVLALLLYALDDARGPVVGWIANRNALVAVALAIPVLVVHDRWRREGWRAGAWLGPLLLLVALGAGEAALAIVAYLAAHALWLDRAPARARLRALAPYAAVVVAWRVVYGLLGYGVSGSGIYLDPGADPVAFAAAAVTRVPLLLLGQLGLPWSDLASLYPLLGAGVLLTMVLVAVAALAAIGLACARLLRVDPLARFHATGMLLAAVPVASTFPSDRLLGFVGLGAMGLVAQLLAAALRQRELLGEGRPRRALAWTVVGALVLTHLVVAPPFLALRARSMVTIGRLLDRADAGIPSDPAVAGQTVILASAPNDAFAGFLPLMRASRRQVRPAHQYWLATATSAVTLERLDDRTLRVRPDGGFLRHEVDRMLRSPARPFRRGERVELTGLTIEIETLTADGRPATVLARFDRPLESPALVWRRWHAGTYVPYQPPAIGARDTLPAVDLLRMLDD
ncbi:MAG: hypothetical protein HS111_20195 [Kofleriaceae bacterium]|nr:hypothetical protein [Kofleriaceae bacterium]MCL4225295.1 hypothetical protein [Myxococcales bacterium]